MLYKSASELVKQDGSIIQYRTKYRMSIQKEERELGRVVLMVAKQSLVE